MVTVGGAPHWELCQFDGISDRHACRLGSRVLVGVGAGSPGRKGPVARGPRMRRRSPGLLYLTDAAKQPGRPPRPLPFAGPSPVLRARLHHLRSASVRTVRGHSSAPPPVDTWRPLGPTSCAAGVPYTAPDTGARPHYRGPAIPGVPGACRVPPEGSR
ncbi:hypothetical protein NDU88_003669 [Pleurodeles waltl]|uniref:Uncharacterized protein n=1 Tax=Pleurodeles waltl TaxID=8319 RepID=A0AAV7UZ41_PLEWA|nr:hypothetical protein NDU88_003669 [Pleurodeles waltl]